MIGPGTFAYGCRSDSPRVGDAALSGGLWRSWHRSCPVRKSDSFHALCLDRSVPEMQSILAIPGPIPSVCSCFGAFTDQTVFPRLPSGSYETPGKQMDQVFTIGRCGGTFSHAVGAIRDDQTTTL